MRPRMLMLAGWAHGKDALDPLAGFLAPAYDISTASVGDLPAAFASAKPADDPARTVSEYAHGLGAIAAGCDPLRCAVGWSMGAMVALEAIAAQTVRVDRLVVIGGTPCFCLAAGWAAGVPPQAVRAMRTGLRSRPESTLGRFFEDVMFPRGDAADAARSRVRHALSAAPGALVHGLDYLRRTDLRNQLRAVDIPVLVIHGRQDRIVPWEAGRFLAGHLAGSRFVLYDSFGHNLPGDDPGAVARDIAEFLEAEN